MPFEMHQIRKLKSQLKPQNIRTRQEDGITLRYVEGWHVISEANRIFGFDGWDRELVEAKCVFTKMSGNRYAAAYVARIRITVHAGDERRVMREGSGAGEATTDSPGSAHEMALKAAETDAMKRALMTFGNPFGLSLYSNHTAEPAASNQARLSTSSSEADANRSAQHNDRQSSPKVPSVSRRSENETYAPPSKLALAKGASVGHVEKSELAIGEPKRHRNTAHLRLVASRRCLICGKNRSHAHHLTFTQPRAMGRKVSDEFTVPLCSDHHQELHLSGNERAWWIGKSIDPLPIAAQLWERSIAAKVGMPVV